MPRLAGDHLVIAGRLDGARGRNHPVAAIAVRLDQRCADTLRRACNDGNLLFAIHGNLRYGFKTPLNTAGANSTTVRSTTTANMANAMYWVEGACLLGEMRMVTDSRIQPAQTSLIATSMLPRVALEYGQIWSASSSSAWATSRARPGRLTLRRALRK